MIAAYLVAACVVAVLATTWIVLWRRVRGHERYLALPVVQMPSIASLPSSYFPYGSGSTDFLIWYDPR